MTSREFTRHQQARRSGLRRAMHGFGAKGTALYAVNHAVMMAQLRASLHPYYNPAWRDPGKSWFTEAAKVLAAKQSCGCPRGVCEYFGEYKEGCRDLAMRATHS